MLGFNFLGLTSLLLANVAHGTPTMRESMDHWGGFGSLVKIAMANGKTSWSTKGAHLASGAAPGEPGAVIVGNEATAAPFYVFDQQLYQVQNTSSILYVNIVNTTSPETTIISQGYLSGSINDATSSDPQAVQRVMSKSRSAHTRLPSFKLELDTKPNGVRGQWMYDEGAGRLAFMTYGTQKLSGNFYSCLDRKTEKYAVYVDLDVSTSFPIACQLMKMY